LPEDASAETIEIVKKAYGLDQPLPMQYLIWLGRALRGDLGMSIATGRQVSGEILKALANTLILSVGAIALSFSLAFALGMISGYLNGSWADRLVTGFAVVGVSVPNYWLGIVLVIIFSVEYPLLPATGMGPGGSDTFSLVNPDHLRHLILPVATLSLIPMGIIARTTRAAVSEALHQEFVHTLRAKGLQEWAVAIHVVRNALPQVLAVMGLQFGYLLGGSILVETIFTWPGTGFLLNKAILTRDIPILQGAILVLAIFFVVTNLLVDLLQTAVDPRMQRS
jgi:peptide/nickel transport system permease protein